DKLSDSLSAGIDVCARGDAGEDLGGFGLRLRLGAPQRDVLGLPAARRRIDSKIVFEAPGALAPAGEVPPTGSFPSLGFGQVTWTAGRLTIAVQTRPFRDSTASRCCVGSLLRNCVISGVQAASTASRRQSTSSVHGPVIPWRRAAR